MVLYTEYLNLIHIQLLNSKILFLWLLEKGPTSYVEEVTKHVTEQRVVGVQNEVQDRLCLCKGDGKRVRKPELSIAVHTLYPGGWRSSSGKKEAWGPTWAPITLTQSFHFSPQRNIMGKLQKFMRKVYERNPRVLEKTRSRCAVQRTTSQVCSLSLGSSQEGGSSYFQELSQIKVLPHKKSTALWVSNQADRLASNSFLQGMGQEKVGVILWHAVGLGGKHRVLPTSEPP